MTDSLKLQLEQINFTVGNLDGNCGKITNAYEKAKDNDVDLVVFSELSVTGYPPEDLLLKDYFIHEVQKKIEEICQITKNQKVAILFGAPVLFVNKYDDKNLHNSAILVDNGEVIYIACKSNLPNHGVFDERRYFSPASNLTCVNFRGFEIAMLICEDIWSLKNAFLLHDKGLDAVLTIHASPFTKNKFEERVSIASKFIEHVKRPLIYVNQVGGQDSLVFDGSSFVLGSKGDVVLNMKEFEEDGAIIEINKSGDVRVASESVSDKIIIEEERVYKALVLGLRDYISKNGFSNVVVGMSGGIDSALVSVIAVDALGSDKVRLVALPSKYNSEESFKDAKQCSDNLGVELEIVSIEPVREAMLSTLSEKFSGVQEGITEENIQSRIRGDILMAISNKFGNLLLSTGNKSELAVGYATIYGDMCGAFNPIKDVYKTEVFKLVKWRNENISDLFVYKKKDLISENIINKAPTAELRENQKDSDSLPEYDILDKVLFGLVEERKSIDEVISLGFDERVVKDIAKLLHNSEYKRRQSVIGPKVSNMSFDGDYRYPITNRYDK